MTIYLFKMMHIFGAKEGRSGVEVPESQIVIPASSGSKMRVDERGLPKACDIGTRANNGLWNGGRGRARLVFYSTS